MLFNRRRLVAAAATLFEHLPRRPAPEINVKIAKIFRVVSDTPLLWRLPVVQRRIPVIGEATLLDPATFTHCRVLVRRVADDDRNRLGPLDLVRFLLAFR